MINTKGLYLDCEPIDQPQGTWRDAKNIIISKSNGAYTNEDGTALSAKAGQYGLTPTAGYPVNIAEPIGSAVYPDNEVVIFSAGKNGGKDRIGIMDRNEIYIDLIVDNILNFRTENPIRSAEVDFNFKNQRIVTWTDNFNSPRILNIDELPFPLNVDLSLVNPDNWVNTEIFPKFKTPIIGFTVNDNGGALLAGNYSVCIAYENIDGTRTPNSIPIKNINITDDPKSIGSNKYDGVAPGSLTSKSITFAISNIDTNYDKLVIIVVYKSNNQIVAKEVKKADISGSSLTVTYIGTETTIDLNLEEVLAIRPLYNKVAAMTQLNSILYHANLQSEDDIDFQSQANNIKIFYNSRLVDVDDLENSQKASYPSGFAHGGVYAFYIHLILKNGSLSRGFHIPGRTSQTGDLDIANNAINQGLPATTQRYQVENTTDFGNPSYTNSGGTNIITNTAGVSNMGYWHNKDEVYPQGFPSLGGTRVRHHVFPSIRHCKTYHYSGETRYGANKLDILGIDVVGVNIPSNLQDRVEGWIISYARRDYVNSNVLGTDLALMAHSVETDTNRVWFAGGNWNVDARQDTGDGDSDWGNDLNMRTDYARGHCFDLLRDKPQINSQALYADFEIRLINNCTDQAYDVVGINGCNIAQSGAGAGQNAGALIDYRSLTNISTSVWGLAQHRMRRLSDFRYLPNGIIDGNIWTIKNEECISYKIEGGYDPVPTKIRVNSSSRSAGTLFSESTGPEETNLITFKQVRDNVFANYDQQILVMTDTISLKSDTSKRQIRGGDTFVSFTSFIASCPRFGSDTNGVDGITVIRAHISESRYNIGLRYEVLGNVNSKYYPKTPANEFWSNPSNPSSDNTTMIFSRFSNINEPVYSNDYNAINDLSQPVIYSPDQITVNKFPFRVIKSGVSGTNAQGLNSWKTYLSNDYYESNRNRGAIENIVSIDDILLIHHLYGLFRTLNNERLSVGSTEVYLGTGDIFSQAPKEPVSTKIGYLGNQNIFASFTFKGTYAWIDQSQGKVFTINKQGVVEISAQGMLNFFRDNTIFKNILSKEIVQNNPITGNCIIGGFDPKFRRLIFTKNARTLVDPSFTLSYSIDYNCWVAFHDYTPNLYFNTTTQLFGFKSGAVYKFNNPASKGKYLDAVSPSSSYIDIVHAFRDREGKPIDVHFFSVNWITSVYSNLGTLLRDKTLSHLTARTGYQNMPRVSLLPHTIFAAYSNTRKINNKWSFNKIKTSNSDPFKRKPLIDKYCIIRYEYDNAVNLDSSQNSLYLESVACEIRPATA